MRRYHEFHGRRDPAGLSAEHVTAFLNALATRRHVATSTQNQALAALLFLYRTFLASSSPGSTTSSTPRRPHAFRSCTRDEVRAVLARMDGEPRLMATLLYGCGLRLLECCRLRVKDVDFGRNQITIRRGKGDKDRATMLPVSIKSELAVHLERVRTQHERDLANGAGWVELPVLSRPALDVDARGGEDPGFGDNTLLGRLEMIGDRLVLEVNSAGRLARARQWLEGLPGVSFERATARDVLSESRPVDDKLPARPVRSSRRCCARSSRCTATSFEVGWISRSPLSVVSPRARRARHRKAGVGWNGWCARCRPPRTREERSRLCATSSCASSG